MFRNLGIFLLLILGLSNAHANSVHLGLRINYKTAMSHVEKKDMPVVILLKKISDVLPNSKILISGHTDSLGSYETNVELSAGRAEILKLLLVKNGMDANRIQTKWFSFDAPIDTNETETGRSNNRRVVATIYGLTPKQSEKLVKAAKASNRFYVIDVESDKVTDFVDNVLEPQVETTVDNEALKKAEEEARRAEELKAQKLKEEALLLEEQKKAEQLLKEQQEAEARKLRAESWRKFKEKQRYSLGYEVSDNQLTANSAGFEAIWVTDFNHGLRLAYQYNLAPKFWLGLEASYKFRKFRLDDNLIYNWDGSAPNLLSFAIISDFAFNEKLNFGFDIKYFEDNFIIYNGLNIDLEKASLLSAIIRTDYKIQSSTKYTTRINFWLENPLLGFGALDPSGSLSYYGGLDFSFIKLHKIYDFNISLIYGLRNFENIQNEQTEKYLGFEIKIRNKKW